MIPGEPLARFSSYTTSRYALAERNLRRSRSMAKLPKFTLKHNDKKGRWDLTEDGANRPKATFSRKSDAIKGGVLEEALGRKGGSVKIQKKDGDYQEERTYPGAADPKTSR